MSIKCFTVILACKRIRMIFRGASEHIGIHVTQTDNVGLWVFMDFLSIMSTNGSGDAD